MKRTQVFKKTLLSVAVVTALGGNVGLIYSASDIKPMKVNPAHIIAGSESGRWMDVVGQITQFGGESSANYEIANELLETILEGAGTGMATLKAYGDDVQAKQEAVSSAQTALYQASAADKNNQKKKLQKANESLNNAQQELSQKGTQLLADLFVELNQKAKQTLFDIVTDSG